MKKITAFFARLSKDEKGVTTVEYALMLVLVALAVATIGTQLGSVIKNVFSNMIVAL